MKHRIFWAGILFTFGFSTVTWGESTSVRWTGAEDRNSNFDHILTLLQSKTHYGLTAHDFRLIEDRDLSRYHFQMWVQTSENMPIQSRSLRIWTDLITGDTIQIEAKLDHPRSPSTQFNTLRRHSPGISLQKLREQLSSQDTLDLVQHHINSEHEDSKIKGMTWQDLWINGEPIRLVQVKGQRGKHWIQISLIYQTIINARYQEYPQGQFPAQVDDFSIRAQVYPYYEELEGNSQILERIPTRLKYLKTKVARVTEDPFLAMKTKKYAFDKLDPVLGLTEEGQAQGYWSMSTVKQDAEKIRNQLSLTDNSPEAGGIILEGKYATVSIHPEAAKMQGLSFEPQYSTQFFPDWQFSETMSEMHPSGSRLGRPLRSWKEAQKRPARRLSDHNPAQYLNDGFDEIQVYYAINTLFDSLRSKGFTDPDLSTRPFHAFLYNPDISMRDNAFYTDDTINFTTYSPKATNYARDNSTIWHELGHGVMDRLMGDEIQLADTGGLSEGMADFIAALVIQDVSHGHPFPGSNHFRILNKTGFFLTNEVHDDGEAYGGALYDLLTSALQKFGSAGLDKVTDLTLDTMRLTRNHPGLTASDWFNHMLFADEQGSGSATRAPYELRDLILNSLSQRNFSLDGQKLAAFTLKNGDEEVVSNGAGTREHPISLHILPNQNQAFHLSVSVSNGENYQFKFPVQVKVFFDKGPLQGAVHWNEKEKGPLTATLESEASIANFDLNVKGTCDQVNREDGSCVDYAYFQIFNAGETEKPEAKKRFYVRVKNQAS